MINDVKLEKFEGPLDLLLQLIEQEEMNITDISLSKVTEQFLAYLNTLEEHAPEELATFLVVATKLVYLKSKHLLPYLLPQEDEGPSLADQLKLYKRYADAAKDIEAIWNGAKTAYGRIEPPMHVEGFVMPSNATTLDLNGSFHNLLKRLKPVAALPEVQINHSVSVKQKIESIYNAVKQWGTLRFTELIKGAEGKTEIIVSFLALLELIKQDKIMIEQSTSFSDMEISQA